MRLTDYDETTALNFHLGLDVISQTYTEVIASFNKQSRVIYIIDPPYPSTDISTYGKTSPLSFKEHLDVASLMHTHNAIYFTSNKGNLVEFHDWLIDNNHRGVFSPTAKIHTRINHLSKYVRYRDYMIVDITR